MLWLAAEALGFIAELKWELQLVTSPKDLLFRVYVREKYLHPEEASHCILA